MQRRTGLDVLDPLDDFFPGEEFLRARDDEIRVRLDDEVTPREGRALLNRITQSFGTNEDGTC